MKRSEFQRDGLKLSYLDPGGGGKVMVALHGHWMEGLTYAPPMAALAPKWRVIALDQRGMGTRMMRRATPVQIIWTILKRSSRISGYGALWCYWATPWVGSMLTNLPRGIPIKSGRSLLKTLVLSCRMT